MDALNASKLAEGDIDLGPESTTPHAADRLERLWQEIEGNDSLYTNSRELDEVLREAEDLAPDVFDAALWLLQGPIGIAGSYAAALLRDVPQVFSALSRVEHLFDQDGLERLVERNLNPLFVADSGVELRVNAVDILTGELRYFTETGATLDRDFNVIAPDGSVDVRRAVLASSAIPAIFARVPIGEAEYVDGALREDVPLRAVLEQHPTSVVVVNTFPSQFEPAGLAPAADLPAQPGALDTFMTAVEILADEVAR
jgi:predicted acylesterase/phospholipase RssA